MEEIKHAHIEKDNHLQNTLAEQQRHIDYLNETNNQCDEGKSKIKEEIKKTIMFKEEEKERIKFLENELHTLRQRKIEQEFSHLQ